MARPTKEESEKLSMRVAFRVTPETHKAYLEKIRASGVSSSDFFRDHIMTNSTELIVQAPLSSDGKSALRILSLLGNNTNQLARAVNTAMLSGLVNDAIAEQILIRLDKILTVAIEARSDVN